MNDHDIDADGDDDESWQRGWYQREEESWRLMKRRLWECGNVEMCGMRNRNGNENVDLECKDSTCRCNALVSFEREYPSQTGKGREPRVVREEGKEMTSETAYPKRTYHTYQFIRYLYLATFEGSIYGIPLVYRWNEIVMANSE